MTALDAFVPAGRRSRSTTRSTWRQPLAVIGIALAVMWLVVGIFAPLLAPYSPLEQTADVLQSPSAGHWFGTDDLGRDILSRVIFGARVSLPLAILLVSLSATIGSTLGTLAGYFRSWVDPVIMRTTDLVFAFPPVILALVVTASLGRGLRNTVLAIVIVAWPTYARVVRSLVLSLATSDYVWSSRLLGSSTRRCLLKEVVPNFAGPVVVLAASELGSAVLLLASLSFLGLGAQPPTAEWGLMVADGSDHFEAWWLATFPGLAIFSAVLAFNFLGDSLRDYFDPRTSSSSEGHG